MNEMKPTVSIVVPIYNEEDGLEDSLKHLRTFYASMSVPCEILLIDDGSTDRTAACLAEAGTPFRVITHPVNRGYGAALKTGIRQARSEWICIVDADGTYPMDQFPDLWKLCQDGADMAVGARVGKNAKIPWLRRPAKWAITKLAAILSGYRIPDLNSGFRVFRKEVALRLNHLLPDSFSFTTTITMSMLAGGYRVEYVPITYLRRSGSSKIKPIQDTYNFTLLILRAAVFFNPLRVFAPPALMCITLSLVFLLYRLFVGPAFLLFALILFITGTQLMAIGLLADLINRRGVQLPGKPEAPPTEPGS